MAMAFVNGFANRLSWLRSDAAYLDKALKSPEAKFILLSKLRPLVRLQQEQDDVWELETASWSQVSSFVKPNILHNDRDDYDEQDPIVVFLGLDERSSTPKDDSSSSPKKPLGIPYFGLEVTPKFESSINEIFNVGSTDSSSASFVELRTFASKMKSENVAVAGTARALVDWNRKNKYCAGCGNKLRPLFGGWKRGIPPSELSKLQIPSTETCISARDGKHYFIYPRNDPVVIMAVSNPSGDKLLLGKNRNFPGRFYSCLAGFCEPGESIEEAVVREVWEEAGVKVSDVKYFSSQPWPFPGSLMIGAIAVAEKETDIRTDLDDELEDARFFPRQVLSEVLNDPSRSTLSRQDIDRIDAGASFSGKLASDETDHDIYKQVRLPPPSAIAHQLIKAWVNETS